MGVMCTSCQPRYGHGPDEGQRGAEHRGDDVRGATRMRICRPWRVTVMCQDIALRAFLKMGDPQ